MATIGLKQYRGVVTVLDTGLNSLGSSSGKVVSAELDNDTDLDVFADLFLAVTFASAPTADSMVELFVLPSIDGGTTYPDGSASIEPQTYLYVGGFTVRAVTTAQVRMLRGIALPPGKYKYLVRNNTNQAFPASGSTLRHNLYQLQSV